MAATVWIGLLRGVNVGGKHSLSMKAVKELFEDAGHREVVTYIQSGNVVFESDDTEAALCADLERRLAAAAGFAVPVVLRSAAEMRAVVQRQPFTHADAAHVHVSFLAAPPPKGALGTVDLDAVAPEGAAVVGRELYLHLPNGVGRARVPIAIGKVPGLREGTLRNWRTVTKLVELSAR
ncbi:MAG TPA: DUF1697 domain-containing protein [Ilumatobacteraceae bacterium]